MPDKHTQTYNNPRYGKKESFKRYDTPSNPLHETRQAELMGQQKLELVDEVPSAIPASIQKRVEVPSASEAVKALSREVTKAMQEFGPHSTQYADALSALNQQMRSERRGTR